MYQMIMPKYTAKAIVFEHLYEYSFLETHNFGLNWQVLKNTLK